MSGLGDYPVEWWKRYLETVLTECDGDLTLAARVARLPATEFERLWRETAGAWSFAEVNELIERHNRNFPAEARLAMDPRTRDFVKINGKPYRREPLDADWILERWPADLERLRIDVDDRGEAGAPHRGRGGGE